MAQRVIVRFSEQEFYDINTDGPRVRFMATMSSGSFWSDVPLEGSRSLRRDRAEFKQTVVDMIQAGSPPVFIELEGQGAEQ